MFKKYNNSTVGGVLRNILFAGIILFLLAILFFYVYLPGVTNKGESITVPNIEGMHVDELQEFLVKRNLRWEVNDSSYSEKYPPLSVLKQFPHAGAKVKENRKIFISVNRISPPTVPVPDLVNGTVLNADAMLRANELKRGRIELVRGPFNIIKAMKYKGRTIEANTRVPKGSMIDLVVMDGGNKKFLAPDLEGNTLEDAKLLIFGSDLNLGRIVIVGDTIGEEPVVLKQKPGARQNIMVGDVVDLWIGKPGTEIADD